MIPAETQAAHRHRRDRLMEKLGQGTAIFRSAPLAVMHNDVEYNFRQDSDFYYLTGFNEPDAVAVLAPHHDEHRYILFVQPKDPERETWTGYRVGVEAAQERYGADAVYSITELWTHLPKYMAQADRIYYHLGRDQEFNNAILALWQRFLRSYPRHGQGPTALEDPGPILHGLRQVKDADELARLRRAGEISAAAHCRAMDYARAGCYEYQVQAEIEHCFRLAGAMGPAYPSIVASGPNACILHYTENTRQMQDGDLLLIDAGCAVDYYNGDITRTFPISGKFSDEQRLLYEIVLEAQHQAIALAQPGQPYQAMHQRAVQVIVDGLLDLGLLVGDRDTLIATEAYKPFYMHRTGHWLGLDVHDVGVYQHGDRSHCLEPGHVFTVEPGIYISPTIQLAEDQPPVPEQWRGIGIRIEDDLVITEQGHDVLTAGVPKAIADITR
jgi:Xaa-Pro aminopeptidase